MNGTNKTIGGGVMMLNIEQAQRALALLLLAKVPACLIGGVGCGKTTAVEAVGEKARKNVPNFKVWTKILSYCAEEDLGGVPVPNTDNGRVKYLMPEDMPFDEDATGILFFDEFDRAREQVQTAALQYLLGGNVNGHKVPAGVFPVLAMNGESDIYTNPLSAAAVTRLCTLFVSSQAAGNQQSYDAWALENDVSPVIRGFARWCPDLVKSFDAFEELARPTPRTRDMAGRILDVVDEVSFQTDDILLPCLAGVVGKAAAVQLIAFRELFGTLPDLEAVLSNPEGADVPTEMSARYAIVAALSSRVTTADRGEAAIKYAIRCGNEMASFIVGVLPVKCPAVVTTPTYLNFVNNNQ